MRRGCRAREDERRGEKKTSRYERSTLVGALKAPRRVSVDGHVGSLSVSGRGCAAGGWLRKYFHYK